MAPAKAKEARKANKRGAARLAAVQALYQMDLAGTGLNEIMAEFESHWLGGEVEGAQYRPAEAAFFATSSAASCASKLASTRKSTRRSRAAGRSSASRRYYGRCSAPALTSLHAGPMCRRAS